MNPPWASYVPVLRAADLGDRPVAVVLGGERFALFRDAGGRARAVLDRCPHRFAPLSAGKVMGGRITCPYHGWNFAGDGEGRSPTQPERNDCATEALATQEAHGAVWLAPWSPGERSSDNVQLTDTLAGHIAALPRMGGSSKLRRFLGGVDSSQPAQVEVAAWAPRVRLGASQKTASGSTYQRLVVREKIVESPTITSFVLAAPEGAELSRFRAGQHVLVRAPLANGTGRMTRSYSLSSDCGEAAPCSYRISVRRICSGDRKGAMSTYLHDIVAVTDSLEVAGPFGEFHLPNEVPTDTKTLILVAGGVGITPLFAMLQERLRRAPASRIRLVYGVHSVGDIFRRGELEAWATQHAHFDLRFVVGSELEPVSVPIAGTAERRWEAGRVSADSVIGTLEPEACSVYLCGPVEMMTTLTASLAARGVTDISSEKFQPALAATGLGMQGARIKLLRSGRELVWPSNAANLLEVALDAGVELDYGCRIGSCGTCKVPLRRGEVRHLAETPQTGSPADCLACIAVPQTDIELDA
jgi:uncharacterized protein